MILAILDTETTGLDVPEHDEIVEIALATYDTHHGLLEAACGLVPGDRPIGESHYVHGISDDARATGAWCPGEAWAWIAMRGCDYVCAHNADFDARALGWVDASPAQWLDTMDLPWGERVRQGASLTNTALALGVSVVAAHRALDDVLTLVRCLDRCRESGRDLDAMVEHAARPKVQVVAQVSFDDRQIAKNAGFRWDAGARQWWRRMAAEDVDALPFRCRVVGEP